MKIQKNKSLVVALIGLTVGLVAGVVCAKSYDSRTEKRNYLGRKCIESAQIMSDVSDLKLNNIGNLESRMHARLDRSTLIISLFIDDSKTGPVARNMLHDIYEFRLKYPYEIMDKMNKDKIESALALGKEFHPSLEQK